MNCETIREQLIDLWRGDLSADQQEAVEGHLAGCKECERESARLGSLWSELAALDNEAAPPVPSESLRQRFYPALEAHQRKLERPSLWRRWLSAFSGSGSPTLRPAWSMPNLVLGIALGAAVMWAVGARDRIERLSAEVDDLRGTASLSLLANDSASERLRGVSWGSQVLADDRIVDALLDSVRHDPNVNVRLAALDALARKIDSPRVHAGLAQTLPNQQSPVLQVALAEVLRERNGGSTVALEELLERRDLDEQVRTQVRFLLESV